MTNQPIGTPGNDGLPGARDPRPRWPAGSQPNTPRPTWGGTPGVPANPWQGVRRHAVKPDPPAVPDDTNHDPSQGVCRHAARTNRTAWPPAQDAADKNGNHNWMLGTRIGEAKNPGPTHPGRDARTAETQREDPRGRPAQPPKHSRGWEHPNQRVNNNGPPQHPRTGGKGKGRPHGGRGSQQPRDPHTTHPGGRNGQGGGKSHQAKGAGPKGGWQTAQGNDERRLRDRLRTLEHELRDIRGRLDEPRHRPRAVAPEQRGVPDDNPWQPLRRRPRGRRRSIGFEPPSRRPGPPREREREASPQPRGGPREGDQGGGGASRRRRQRRRRGRRGGDLGPGATTAADRGPARDRRGGRGGPGRQGAGEDTPHGGHRSCPRCPTCGGDYLMADDTDVDDQVCGPAGGGNPGAPDPGAGSGRRRESRAGPTGGAPPPHHSTKGGPKGGSKGGKGGKGSKGGKGGEGKGKGKGGGGKGGQSGEGGRGRGKGKGGKGKGQHTPSGNRESHAGDRGHLTTGGSKITASVARENPTRDDRQLPYPIHGKHARDVQRSTGRQQWTWGSWEDWHTNAVQRRNWRKGAITRMLELRQAEARARGDTYDYYSCDAAASRNGMVYGAYHFPTGRWYVGQTINTVRERARQHWWARKSAKDFLHLAMADDPDPMTWIAFPLEAIPKELWRCPPSERQADWRKRERARFRAVATPRERYWVDKLRSMWPKGWNSQYPGKPASAGCQPRPHTDPPREPARDLEAAKTAIQQWETDPRSARRWIQNAAREDLVEILEGLDKGLAPSQQTAVTAAIAAEAREALRKRKAEKKARDFVRFFYSHPIAEKMGLPDIIRDPEVYKLHPDPDVGAAIMVVHKFAPQIASALFNYKEWAMSPKPMEAGGEAQCPCHTQVRPNATLVEGHVLSTEPEELASPYLRDILSKGKKYRLKQPVHTVLTRLKEGLDQYVDYKVKTNQNDADYERALHKWAEAVTARAEARMVEAARENPQEPDGYPDLDRQLKAAKTALVFGPEDRAPHALFFACGRLYAAKLNERLEQANAFSKETRPPKDLLEHIRSLNEDLQLIHHGRLPYLYGAWKAKKKAFRWIAGTARNQDERDPDAPEPDDDGKPKNALSEAGRLMVKVLQNVMRTLRRKDREWVGQGNKARYWVIEDIDEFVQEFRVLAAGRALNSVPWATYDFTTMYEALEHDRLVDGVMTAAKEAWEEETLAWARQTGQHRNDVELRLGAPGWMEAAKVRDAPGQPWFTVKRLEDTLRTMLANLYAVNGGVVRRQQRGVPMGLECSPQLANLYAYAVESAWVDRVAPTNVLMRRYIDDIIVMGPDALVPGRGLPAEVEYGMNYKLTAEEENNLIYLGVRLFVDDRGYAHSVLHDRAVDYPIRVDRYPEGTTVANPSQLAGVIMGRLVAAQRTCSRMDLFQDAVAGVFTHAHRRGYSRRMVHSTWTRFLWRYWDAAAVTTRELRAWFHDAWRAVTEAERGPRSQPLGKWPRWEVPVPKPRTAHGPTPHADDARTEPGAGTQEAQASKTSHTQTRNELIRRQQPIDDIMDLLTPPRGHTPEGQDDNHTEREEGGQPTPNGGASSSSLRPAPPLIPYPSQAPRRDTHHGEGPPGNDGPRGGPMRVGRGNERAGGRKGNTPVRRPYSTPVYPASHARTSGWGLGLPTLCPEGAWGRGEAGEHPITGPVHPASRGPISGRGLGLSTLCPEGAWGRGVAGEHPASSSSTPMWLDDTHNGTSAGAPNSQPAERETGPPSMQLVPVPTPYAVPVHTPVIIPYPVAVPVYIDRPVPVPTYVDRAVPVYVERWARVDRAWPGLEGGDPTPHRAATVPGSMHLPPALLRHILRMGSPGPMRAPRPRGATSTGPYPTEWEMASPEWAMCVEIARRLNDAQRGPQEPAQPHAPPPRDRRRPDGPDDGDGDGDRAHGHRTAVAARQAPGGGNGRGELQHGRPSLAAKPADPTKAAVHKTGRLADRMAERVRGVQGGRRRRGAPNDLAGVGPKPKRPGLVERLEAPPGGHPPVGKRGRADRARGTAAEPRRAQHADKAQQQEAEQQQEQQQQHPEQEHRGRRTRRRRQRRRQRGQRQQRRANTAKPTRKARAGPTGATRARRAPPRTKPITRAIHTREPRARVEAQSRKGGPRVARSPAATDPTIVFFLLTSHDDQSTHRHARQ